MRSHPNEAKIAAVQVVAWRRLGTDGRIRVAAEMSAETRRIAVERIRRQNPSLTEEEVHRELTSALYGRAAGGARALRAPTTSIALEEALGRLLALFEALSIPFMLTGSLASTAHGVPRAATDLDVVIDPSFEAAATLLATFERGGWHVDGGGTSARAALLAREGIVLVDDATTWKADLIVRKERPYSVAEFARREHMDVLGVQAWVTSAEDTIISKLEWAQHARDAQVRAQQLRDVAGVVSSRGAQLDRAYVDRWVSELGLAIEWSCATEP